MKFGRSIRLEVLYFRARRKQANRGSFRSKRNIVTFARFQAPIQLFRSLICGRSFSSNDVRFFDRFYGAFSLGVGVIRVSVGAFALFRPRIFLNVLRRRDNLSCATYPFSTGRAIIPVGLIRRNAAGGDINILCGVHVYSRGDLRRSVSTVNYLLRE